MRVFEHKGVYYNLDKVLRFRVTGTSVEECTSIRLDFDNDYLTCYVEGGDADALLELLKSWQGDMIDSAMNYEFELNDEPEDEEHE